MRSFWLGLCLLLPGLGAGACASTSLPRETLRPGSTWTRVNVRPVLQRGRHDCAVAAAATFWSAHDNRAVSYEEAARKLRLSVTPAGVPLSSIKAATVSATRSAFIFRGDRATLAHELRSGRPVFLGVHVRGWRGPMGHFIVLLGCEEDCLRAPAPGARRWLIWDPAAGVGARAGYRLLDDTTLDRVWRPAGFATMVSLPLRPAPATALGR